MGRKNRKVNPRRIPVSEADVKKAKESAVSEAVEIAWAIFFTVLRDKEGMEAEQLRRIWKNVNNLSDGISEGYVSVRDLMKALQDEAGITIGMEEKGHES